MHLSSLKRQSNEIFFPPIFTLMDSSQATYSVFKDFSNLASNSVRYSQFLIDSALYFKVESRYSLNCLLRRVVTLRIILAGSHHLLALSAYNSCLAYRLIRRVNTPRIDYYGESLHTFLLIYSGESLLTAKSYFQKLWRTPPSFKGTMKQKMDYPCRALLTKNISKESKIWVT